MENPLLLEERVNVTRLISHDVASHQNELARVAVDPENSDVSRASYLNRHVMKVLASITLMSTNDECYFLQLRPEKVELCLDQLSKIFSFKEIDLKTEYSIRDPIRSEDAIVYTLLYNLVKNAVQINGPGVGVSVSADEYFGCVRDSVYQSPETKRDGGFIRFRVHDNGKGFPQDRPFSDFLQLGVSTSKKVRKGFGLYYAQLACKFLRAHMEINSQPEDTNITIYHPVNLKRP